MSFRFVEDRRDTYPVRLTYAVLEVWPAGYYAWRGSAASERTKFNAVLLDTTRQVHHDSYYGSPRVHAAVASAAAGSSE